MSLLVNLRNYKTFIFTFTLCQAICHAVVGNEISSSQRQSLKDIDTRLALCNQVVIREATIADLQKALSESHLTSAQLTECYLNRIMQMDVYLKSVIETNPDATDIAKKLDQERADGNLRGPLHGIPILIKDNIATKDKMNTTAGAEAMLLVKPKEDAEVVKKLRAAGAIILGKNNLSEWIGFRDPQIPEGASTRGGIPRNPYSKDVPTSGSSSGSAVSIAANLAAAAIATESDNSIIGPSSLSSCVGIKPTVNLTSPEGTMKLIDSQDSVGVIARTVQDARIVLQSIIDEPVAENRPAHWPAESLEWTSSSQKTRIGIAWSQYWNNSLIEQQLPKLNESMATLIDIGLEIVPEITISTLDNIDEGVIDGGTREMYVLLYDFKKETNHFLQSLTENSTNSSRIRSLQDIIRYNKNNPGTRGWQQEYLELAQDMSEANTTMYEKFRDENIKFARDGLDKLFDEHNIDVIAVPSHPFIDSARTSAIAGYPIVTIPVGYLEDKTPFGISFFGPPLSEPKLLALAEKIENDLRARNIPEFTN